MQAWSTWTDAEAEAVRLGGHLVTKNTAAENAWLTETSRTHQGPSWRRREQHSMDRILRRQSQIISGSGPAENLLPTRTTTPCGPREEPMDISIWPYIPMGPERGMLAGGMSRRRAITPKVS